MIAEGDGRLAVYASTDARHASLSYDDAVAPNWSYQGRFGRHGWKVEAAADPVVAVNARRTYWRSQTPIPGGTSFENIELRTAFRHGERFWFSVEPDSSG